MNGRVTCCFASAVAWAKTKAEEKIMSIMNKTADFIRSRKGASMLLASAVLVGSIFISSNLSVVDVFLDKKTS